MRLTLSGRLWWSDLWAANPGPPPALQPLNRFPRMVQEYFVERVRAVEREAEKVRNGLKTKADAEQYVADGAARRSAQCFGPLPEKTPLNARITGVVERDAYKIEKVIFESRPGFLVTANLYVPKGRKFPLPGVVGTCGHSDNGKAAEAYQSFAQGLARHGLRRADLRSARPGRAARSIPTRSSSRGSASASASTCCAGNQQFLVGEFLGTWRAWDGIRALDYLLTRAGGRSAARRRDRQLRRRHDDHLALRRRAALDHGRPVLLRDHLPPQPGERTAGRHRAVPAAGPGPGPRPRRFPGRPGPQAGHHPGQGEGLLRRPRRRRGLRAAQAALRACWAPRRTSACSSARPTHGYTQENREAMYRWFNRVTGVSEATTEPTLTIEKDETLWCTPSGQVADLKSRTVFSFTKAKSQELAKTRRPLGRRGAARGDRRRPASCRATTARARLPHPAPHRRPQVSASRTARPTPSRPSRASRRWSYLLGDAAARLAPAAGAATRAVLYVAHHSSDAELRDEPLVAELIKAEPKAVFYACDVRGIGESRPDTCGKDQFLAALRQRLLLRHPRAHARPALPRPEDVRRAARAGLARGPTATARSTWPPRAGARCRPPSPPLLCAAGRAGDAQERPDLATARSPSRRRTTGRCRRCCRACCARFDLPDCYRAWPPRSSGRSSPGARRPAECQVVRAYPYKAGQLSRDSEPVAARPDDRTPLSRSRERGRGSGTRLSQGWL